MSMFFKNTTHRQIAYLQTCCAAYFKKLIKTGMHRQVKFCAELVIISRNENV